MGKDRSGPSLRLGLAQGLAHWAVYKEGDPALIIGDRAVSYKELDLEARAVQRQLLGKVQPGERIAIVVESKLSLVPALVAVIRSGCTAVICQPAWAPDQLEQVRTDNSVRVALHDIVLPDTGVAFATRIPVPSTSGSEDAVPSPVVRHVDSEWAVLFSSGTTGRPKGIVRSDLSILNELLCWCLELPIGKTTRFYVGRPLFYTGGLVLAAATLMVGGTVISPQLHGTEEFIRMCAKRPPDFAFLHPRQIAELVDHAKRHAIEPLNTVILSMGDFIEPDLKREVPGRLGCKIIESWGNSEGLGTIATAEDTVLRPESIGRPFLGDTLVVTDEQGSPLPFGEHGRLAGSTDSGLSYYQNREDLNRCLIKGDVVISEDIGYRDGHGFFFLVGRAIGFVKRDGVSVNLREIERQGNRLAGVRASCAVALPDGENAESIVIVLEMVAPTASTKEQLRSELNASLPPSHRVDSVRIETELPRNAAGKILLSAVRSACLAELTAPGTSYSVQQRQ